MKQIKGSTLHELLVAILIIGILFLLITEGYQLVRRYATSSLVEMEQEMDSMLIFYNQNRYTMQNDSIITADTTNYINYNYEK